MIVIVEPIISIPSTTEKIIVPISPVAGNSIPLIFSTVI